ncbi:hypothetical protein PRZ48_006315 [Zasmidium cellare]|uniref:Uncharacterized protein n=1 Tax=Zasmidium cellare TaxID=395010 RepID=A0ABR0ENF4_ZASCE|nr:hypothetical protein PRZ48_006315 [Zasmidium cellare]
MKILGLEKTTDKSFFNCVGDTQKGRRCGCQIARHNVESGKDLLCQLPRRSVNPQLLEEDLRAIAYKLLCVRWHRDSQVERMLQRWRPIVVAETARSRARFFQSQTRETEPKTERKASYTERKFKREEDEDRKASTEQPSTPGDEDSQTFSNARNRRTASEQEDFLRREKECCEEARRQSQRERAEQKEAKDRAERERAKRQEEEEARQRKREETPPPPRPQPRPTSTVDWEVSWNTYRQRWTLVKDLPADTTLSDLEKVFPWPLRNIHELGLSIAKLDAAFERDVESFFRHIPSQKPAGAAGDDKKVVLRALRKEALCWHPDKVLVRFPVGAVPKALRELATKITQVLTRLMGIFSV